MATLNIKNFPEDLYSRLKSQAERERRSLSQEVIQLLDRAVEDREAVSLLGLKGLGKEAWKGIEAARHVDEERESWG